MKESEATRLLAALAAYWRADMDEDTVSLWRPEFASYDLTDGLEAARLLGLSLRFMPSLAEFVRTIRDVRNDRLTRMARGLPEATSGQSLGEFLDANPEYRDRVHAVVANRDPA